MKENQRRNIIWKYKSNETYMYMGIYIKCLQHSCTPVRANIRTQHHWNSVRKMMTIIIYQIIISRQSPVIRSTCHNTLQWHAWVTWRHGFHHPTTFLPFKRKWRSDTVTLRIIKQPEKPFIGSFSCSPLEIRSLVVNPTMRWGKSVPLRNLSFRSVVIFFGNTLDRSFLNQT